jgi:transposase
MALNVREVERDQLWLMPPSVADWLPDDHLAWFILDVISELDLTEFYASYRDDGRGGCAYDPALMLGILVYAYCLGERSSRRIETRLVEDVGFRVMGANQCPDHATLARFRARHAEAIATLFAQVLGLCVAEGLVAAGVVAIDGTKLEANASAWSNRTRQQIASEILAEAERTDAAEDALHGDSRGGEMPRAWAARKDRRERLRKALAQLEGEALPADWDDYQARRAAKEAARGRKLQGRKPSASGEKSKIRAANTTDPDSRMLRARNRFLQGYNAQAAVSEDHVIVAAEVTNAAHDSTMFETMVDAAEANLEASGCEDTIGTFVADAGYWSVPNVTLETEAAVLITPMPATAGIADPNDPRLAERRSLVERVDAGELSVAEGARLMGVSQTWARKLLADHRAGIPDPAILRKEMLAKLSTEEGKAAYAKRKTTAEPVFGNVKANLRFRRFSRRGRAAVDSEWKLICAVHNLLKLRNVRLAVG